MDLLKSAVEFEENVSSCKSRDERIKASQTAKELVLALNEIYKKSKDPEIMEVMKRITAIKQKFEKRLKGRLTS
jgi:biotin-(acetyl-CoA carboxylase) ligase